MENKRLIFRKFTGLEGLKKLKHDWQSLLENVSDNQYLHTYEWHLSFMQAFASKNAYYIFYCVYDNDCAVAIFPLYIEYRKTPLFTLKSLTLPTHSHITLHDFIIHDDILCKQSVVSDLTRQLGKDRIHWDYCLFPSVIEGSKAQLQLDYEAYNPAMKNTIDDSYSIDLADTYEDTISHIPGNFRRNVARLERKAQKQGELKFIQAVSTTEEITDYLQQFIEIENDSWKGKNNSSIKSNQKFIDYYRSLTNNFKDKSVCLINFLQINDELIAGQFAIKHNNRLNLLKIGYKEEYSPIGPGNILLSYTLRHCIESPEYDNVNIITSPKWAEKWFNNNKHVYSYYLFRKSPRGILLFLSWRYLLPAFKKIRYRLKIIGKSMSDRTHKDG